MLCGPDPVAAPGRLDHRLISMTPLGSASRRFYRFRLGFQLRNLQGIAGSEGAPEISRWQSRPAAKPPGMSPSHRALEGRWTGGCLTAHLSMQAQSSISAHRTSAFRSGFPPSEMPGCVIQGPKILSRKFQTLPPSLLGCQGLNLDFSRVAVAVRNPGQLRRVEMEGDHVESDDEPAAGAGLRPGC